MGLRYNDTAVINGYPNQESDTFWMEQALLEAKKAAEIGEVPVGAVAVYNDQIIGRGFNCKESEQDPTAHAELLAIQQAAKWFSNWRLIDVTLYSTLEPCPMCAGAMIQSRLSRLIYGAKDIRHGADGSVVDILNVAGFNHKIEVFSGLLKEESAKLLQEFFQGLRNPGS
jgi:tRNA(adenine34) deaminase